MPLRLRTFLRRHRRYLYLCAAGMVVQVMFMGPLFGWYGPLEIYNTSPSVPLGRYWYTWKWPPERGDIVMVHNPPGFTLNWLLKRVEGTGGDLFCWHESEKRHYLNDRPMLIIPPEAVVAAIPIWRGCRMLEADEVVGYGDHHLAYGSQYIGPVKLAQIWGVYRRLE